MQTSEQAGAYTASQERLRARYLEAKLASGDSHASSSEKDLKQELERIGQVAHFCRVNERSR